MRCAVLLGALCLLVAAAPATADDSTPPDIALSVRGDRGAAGWYVGPVTVNWTVSDPESATGFTVLAGCEPSTTLDADTAGATRICRASSEGGTAEKSTTVRVDVTPPAVGGAGPARGPDAGAWFNHAVPVTWSGTDATSGLASCATESYAGPDSATATVAGTCTDRAGNVSARSPYVLRYDATPPTVSGAAPARPPARSGWYTAPVDLLWRGTDATSGIASCTAMRYAGRPAAPSGSCSDHAGNTAAPLRAGLRYDATPPRLTRVRVTVAGGRARVSWRTQAAQVQVSRTPGQRGRASSVVYRGRATRYTDRRIERGRPYVYTVRAVDAAGNATRVSASTDGRRTTWLVAPADGARLTAPPVLRWSAVRGARFYNVQLFRGGEKILTRWPSRARLALGPTWRHAGRTERLGAGTYRWYVWAGHGRRSSPRFGRLLGRRTFTVR